MSQVAVITFRFETGQDPIATIYQNYGNGKSIKGAGKNLVGLAFNTVSDLIDDPLSADKKLPIIKIIKRGDD